MLASSFSVSALGFEAEEVYDSVFVIHSGNSLGSGFAAGPNSVITNAHVIDDADDVKVESYSGEILDAFVVAMDEGLDIAVLGVYNASFKPLENADSDGISIGDDVYAIGAPNSLAYTLTKGVVSSKDRKVGGQSFVQTDAAINSGNSGGPLLDENGAVVGINSYKFSDAEGIGLAIPVNVVTAYIDSQNIDLNAEYHPTEPPLLPDDALATFDQTGASKNQTPTLTIVLAVCLAISAPLNIVLIILLVSKKKGNPPPAQYYPQPDPTERTDFEIEFYD